MNHQRISQETKNLGDNIMLLTKEPKNFTTAQLITTLQELLPELQARTVGLADIDGRMLPIVEYQKASDKIMVVGITDLFAVSMVYMQRESANKAIIFDNDQTVKDYIKAPIAFNKVVKQFNEPAYGTTKEHS